MAVNAQQVWTEELRAVNVREVLMTTPVRGTPGLRPEATTAATIAATRSSLEREPVQVAGAVLTSRAPRGRRASRRRSGRARRRSSRPALQSLTRTTREPRPGASRALFVTVSPVFRRVPVRAP